MLITNGLTLAILTTTAFFIVYKKLPRKIRRWVQAHTLLTDVVALLLTYMLFGGTLTALFAAAMTGLFVSGLLYISNHPEDFLYVEDMIEVAKKKLVELKVKLNELGADYRAKRCLKTEDKAQPVEMSL